MKLFDYSNQITGASWPEIKQVVSPCPTLKVIGAVTKGMVQREELKRMREMGRPGMNLDANGKPIIAPPTKKPSKLKKAAMVTDRVASGVLSNTVGRVGRLASRVFLGRVPETALTGSYHEAGENSQKKSIVKDDKSAESSSQPQDDNVITLQVSQELLEKEVARQLSKEVVQAAKESEKAASTSTSTSDAVIDAEDEALFQGIYEKDTSIGATSTATLGKNQTSTSTKVGA